MEQPNMVPSGMPPQNMNTMQRPQPGNQEQQVFAAILQRLQQSMPQVGPGWQATFDLKQRAIRIMEMITQLRMLQPNGSGFTQSLQVAMSFELKAIQSSGSREHYEVQMRTKQEEIMRRRQQQAQNGQLGLQMPPNMNMPNNNMNGMQPGGIPGFNIANAMGMPNMQQNLNGPQKGNPNMQINSHLQRPMQPSPLPAQQQQPPATMDPAALQNGGLQPQIPNMNQGNPQRPMNMNQPGQSAQPQVTPQEIMHVVQQIMGGMGEDKKQQMRVQLLSRMNEQQRNELMARGSDPLPRLLYPQARQVAMRKKMEQQQNGDGGQMVNGQMPGNMQQTPMMQAGAPNIDFSSILGQQAVALKQQESGEQVVPASNNANFGLGGNMNMPQGINPQMLGNQGGQQGGNGQMQSQLQQALQHQQHQQRMQQQNLLAQQQALQQRQQANQLRGQPGGLNAPNALNGGPAGQVNSPAMSMLNRPMAPPGQGTPTTPQPNRPQGPPQTPMNVATNQLMQHHQAMMNQNNAGMNQGGQAPPPQQQRTPQEMQTLLANPQIQERLAHMPPEHRQQIIKTMREGLPPRANNMPGNMNMNGAPNQQPIFNGIPQNMGTNVPQFNSQPPLNQQPPSQPAPQMNPMQAQQRMQQQQQQQQNGNNIRQRAMDIMPFPRAFLQDLGLAVADDVRQWHQLKAHIMQNQQVIPPGTLHKVNQAQNQWFTSHPEQLNQGVNMLRQQVQQRQSAPQQGQPQGVQQPQPGAPQPPVSGPGGMQMPNGQAPPAQMVPPAALMQAPNQGAGTQQPEMNQGQASRPVPPLQSIGQGDIDSFRKTYPQAAQRTDDQIRHMLWSRRRDHHAQQVQRQQQQQEVLRNAQMQRAQSQVNAANQPAQRAPNQPPQRAPPSQAQSHGQKRAQQQAVENDDVMEIPNPNAPPPQTSRAPAQAPPMQHSQSQQANAQQSFPGMTKEQAEQVKKMPVEQRTQIMAAMQQRQKAQAEALRKAQMGMTTNQQAPQPQPPAQQQGAGNNGAASMTGPSNQQTLLKLRQMHDAIARANPKGPPADLNDQERVQAQATLKRLWRPVDRIGATFPLAATIPNFDSTLAAAMKAKIVLSQNVADENGTIREYLSVTLPQLSHLEHVMNVYFKQVKLAKERIDADAREKALQAGGQQPHVQAQAQTQPPQQQVAPMKGPQQQPEKQAPPLNRKASQQGHGRKASQQSKAPPAPTENKTFDWGVNSPHGVPKYEIRNELTPDKLKFPPAKKRRTGQPDSQGSTPAAQTGTPGAMASPGVPVKGPSPEQARKSQQQQQVKQEMEAEQQRKFRCKDPLCEASIQGFETEESLRRHEDAEHKPVDDPLAFMLGNAGHALGVDQDGKALPAQKAAANVKVQPRATPAPTAKPGFKRDGQTPNVKQEAITPQTSGARSKARTVTSAPVAAEKPEQEKTLREVLEANMGFEPSAQPVAPEPTAPVAMTDDDLFGDMLQTTLTGIEGLEDWTQEYAGVNDWGLRPEQESSPELTPSDGASQSSHASDISQNERLRINMEWDPWATGDTAMPEILKMQMLGLDGSPEIPKKSGEDTEMGEAGAEKQEGDKAVPVEYEWDWSNDAADWNTLFGASAGIEMSVDQDGFGGGGF